MKTYKLGTQTVDAIELKCMVVSRGLKVAKNVYRTYAGNSRLDINPLTCNCMILSDGTIVQLTDTGFHRDANGQAGDGIHESSGYRLLQEGQGDVCGAVHEVQTGTGGSCGFWGCCGVAVSSGIFMSIITGTTPLSSETWGLCSRCTSRVLAALGELGGPRCCKRTCYTALKETVLFVSGELGVEMHLPEKIRCRFHSRNAECLKYW